MLEPESVRIAANITPDNGSATAIVMALRAILKISPGALEEIRAAIAIATTDPKSEQLSPLARKALADCNLARMDQIFAVLKQSASSLTDLLDEERADQESRAAAAKAKRAEAAAAAAAATDAPKPS